MPPVTLRWKNQSAPVWNEAFNLTGGVYSLQNLMANQTYQWQLAAQCPGGGGNSPYSATATFATNCIAPQGLDVNDITAITARLFWQDFHNTYDVQYRTTVNYTPTSAWMLVSGLTTNSISLTGLTPGASYEWQVRSVCGNGQMSAFASPYNNKLFTTHCTLPYALRTEGISSNAARLRWNGPVNLDGNVEGTIDYRYGAAAAYTLQWRAVGAANWNTVSGIASTTYTLTGLTNGQPYEWRLVTDCPGNPAEGGTTGPSTFLTTCTTPNRPVADQLTGTSARLHWLRTGATDQYAVRYRAVGTSAWTTVTPVADTLYRPVNLLAQTRYEWQVSQVCGGQAGAFTSPRQFGLPCGFYTLANGAWNDPAVWSCGTVPTVADAVEIRHRVRVPTSYTGGAATVRYAGGGQLLFETGSRLQTGQ